MVETQTAGGTTERGSATQRHFVREAEQLDGVEVVISHITGKVSLAVDTNPAEVLGLAYEYGGECELGLDSLIKEPTHVYTTGEASINVQFE